MQAMPGSCWHLHSAALADCAVCCPCRCCPLQVLRAANNSLSGPLPASAATSPRLFLLDLHGNSLSGPLPEAWSGPRLQMVMLEDNTLTGGSDLADLWFCDELGLGRRDRGLGQSKHCTRLTRGGWFRAKL
jgi:hypothetical protein